MESNQMSFNISISTKDYIKTVNAKIDGHIYTVHELGAGTSLDLSRHFSDMAKARTQMLNLKGKMESTQDDKYTDEMVACAGTIAEHLKAIEEIFIEAFDDNEDGSKSRKLVHSLGIENIQKIHEQIMKAEANGKESA